MNAAVLNRALFSAPALNRQLFEPHSWLASGWTPGQAGQLEVINPANQQSLLPISLLDAGQIQQAIADAQTSLPAFKALGGAARGQLLRRWGQLLEAQIEELALLLTLEQGKPLAEAKAELQYAASFLFWFAEEANRLDGFIAGQQPNQQLLVIREAVGVCAAITPWNFPAAMITRKAAAALAAGCPILIKPSELTPLTALALAQLSQAAGMPAGVLQVVLADAALAGQQFSQDPRIRKLSFTGSTRVGRLLVAQSAEHLQRLSLELGGHAPFIVCDDADLEAAVEGALHAKLRNNGQTCVAANRFLVHQRLHDAFIDRLRERLPRLPIGPGWLPDTRLGPLIHPAAVDRLQTQIDAAQAQGAQLEYGGNRLQPGFIEPCLLSQVRPEMALFQQESFGPVLPVTAFDDDEQAIALANANAYGLAAYCYSQSLTRSFHYGQRLECGMLGINTGSVSDPRLPFGGIKYSGYGREGSRLGIDEYLNTKTLAIGGLG